MERVHTIEQYKNLVKSNRDNARGGITNNYLGIDSINKYISLGRLFYETMENGYLLYLDEGKYYRMIYCGKNIAVKPIEPKDKPVMLRFIYDINTNKQQEWEEFLCGIGLVKFDNTVQILAKVSEQSDVELKLSKTMRFIERFGFRICYADRNMIDDIMNLRNREPVLSRYHFEFETDDEIYKDIDDGLYRVVLNKENEVIAAQHFKEKNGTINGEWLAVKEEFKLQYGIGGALAYHSFDYAKQKGVEMYYGWVEINNENSLKYHKSLGYKQTDKRSESWIMEAENE